MTLTPRVRELEARHDFDDEATCTQCGFDGAEWHWWKHHTYEGRASDQKMPPCDRALTDSARGGNDE